MTLSTALLRSIRPAMLRRSLRFASCLAAVKPAVPPLILSQLPPALTRVATGTRFSSMNPNDFIAVSLIDSVTFEAVCSDTLESLCDYFEQLVEDCPALKAADVTYGDGVLTVNFGAPHGTYVINRQSPNRQIWLSSPTSGPKRYDFIPDKSAVNEGCWVYKHDGVSLHELLQQEIAVVVGSEVHFLDLPHSRKSA